MFADAIASVDDGLGGIVGGDLSSAYFGMPQDDDVGVGFQSADGVG